MRYSVSLGCMLALGLTGCSGDGPECHEDTADTDCWDGITCTGDLCVDDVCTHEVLECKQFYDDCREHDGVCVIAIGNPLGASTNRYQTELSAAALPGLGSVDAIVLV